jgi:uncharacterized membrane protein YphA (DoxX/SURF4 family)
MIKLTLVLQCVLALVFILSGSLIMANRNKLSTRLSWLKFYSPSTVYLICVTKIAAGLGLLVPLVFHTGTRVAAFSAALITILMLGAAAYHFRKREYRDLPAAVLFLAMSIILFFNI